MSDTSASRSTELSLLESCKQELAGAKEFKALRLLQSVEDRLRNGQSSTPADRSTPSKPAPFVACTLCRQCKAKCVISEPSTGQCDRCKATGCKCVFEGHKRGRKRTRGINVAPVIAEEPSAFNDNDGIGTSRSPHMSVMDMNSDEDEDESESVHQNQPQSAAHPSQFISRSSRPLSLQSLLNPVAHGGQLRTSRGSPREKRGDVVSRGIISLDMARKLFDFFFQALNPIILLFDPYLHTFDYVRAKSSFLFTTILASSARFIAPSISRLLARIVAEYSVQAIFGGRKTVETVQGWMMVYFWKPPKDKRAWTYVGLVCRTATEIGLDHTLVEDEVGATDLQKRERRNCVRTWMLAFMMDRAMAATVGRDWTLRPRNSIIQQARRFSDHPLREHGDAVIAGFTELRAISSAAMDELSPGKFGGSTDNLDVTRKLLTINYDLDEWRTFWQTETDRFCSPPIYMAFLIFFELHIRLTLNSFAVNLQDTMNGFSPSMFDTKVQQAERYCYDLATRSLSQIRTIYDIDASILYHAQDSVSIMVAYAACFLRALVNSSNFMESERLGAISLIAQTSSMFKQVSENTETTAALQADFLESLTAHTEQAPAPNVDFSMFQQAFDGAVPMPLLDNDWLSDFMHTANLFNEPNIVLGEEQPSNQPNALLPQQLDGTDLANLSEVDWDPIMAQWLQLPK
uniref:Zn(2)-C6 fungal-type domain-containing protein n=1 Tax=Kwoniella dejecticola CBS 10117 TaxID=1296121 RepID=A0A1A5ZV44_9TREE|nr:uncharacterized protein I303_07587 [Kwoniella dejecticola CBS 10117]OBR81677.1 hypothetical protein I303_07587 [Kwoniella dejecticola CBS 10117]